MNWTAEFAKHSKEKKELKKKQKQQRSETTTSRHAQLMPAAVQTDGRPGDSLYNYCTNATWYCHPLWVNVMML
jgi:hypothetical protein